MLIRKTWQAIELPLERADGVRPFLEYEFGSILLNFVERRVIPGFDEVAVTIQTWTADRTSLQPSPYLRPTDLDDVLRATLWAKRRFGELCRNH